MICYWRCRRDVIHVSTSPDYTTHHVTTWRSDCCSAGSYCDSCVTSMTLLPFLIVSSAFKDLPFSPLPVFFSLTLASSSSLASTFITLSLLPPCCRRLSLSLSLSLCLLCTLVFCSDPVSLSREAVDVCSSGLNPLEWGTPAWHSALFIRV